MASKVSLGQDCGLELLLTDIVAYARQLRLATIDEDGEPKPKRTLCKEIVDELQRREEKGIPSEYRIIGIAQGAVPKNRSTVLYTVIDVRYLFFPKVSPQPAIHFIEIDRTEKEFDDQGRIKVYWKEYSNPTWEPIENVEKLKEQLPKEPEKEPEKDPEKEKQREKKPATATSATAATSSTAAKSSTTAAAARKRDTPSMLTAPRRLKGPSGEKEEEGPFEKRRKLKATASKEDASSTSKEDTSSTSEEESKTQEEWLKYMFSQIKQGDSTKNVARALMHILRHGVEAFDEDGNLPLMVAAANQRVEMVRFLLERGARANNVNLRRQNALHHLTQSLRSGELTRNAREVIELLVDAGTNVSSSLMSHVKAADETLWKKLYNIEKKRYFKAIADGNVARLKEWYLMGFNNDFDENGYTPLHVAAVHNQTVMAHALLHEYRMDVDIGDKSNATTPLIAMIQKIAKHEKLSKKTKAMIEFLIGAPKADIDSKKFNNKTALDVAKEMGNVEVISILKSAVESRQEYKKWKQEYRDFRKEYLPEEPSPPPTPPYSRGADYSPRSFDERGSPRSRRRRTLPDDASDKRLSDECAVCIKGLKEMDLWSWPANHKLSDLEREQFKKKANQWLLKNTTDKLHLTDSKDPKFKEATEKAQFVNVCRRLVLDKKC